VQLVVELGQQDKEIMAALQGLEIHLEAVVEHPLSVLMGQAIQVEMVVLVLLHP
jgi:hypothetical protein